MKNLQLSPNVKKYFVNALKSLGLRGKQPSISGNKAIYPEMLENEIAQFLDNPATTFSDISEKIKFAIAQQYLFDLGPDSYIEQKTAYDRATVANMLGVLGINDSKQLLATQVFPGVTVIQNEGQNIYHASGELVPDNVLKVVIDSMRKGVTEQKIIKNKNDFNQINNIWSNILYADYNNEKNKLGNQGQNYSYEKFCLDNLKKRVYENIKSSVNSFDDVKANGVLNRKIKEDDNERTLWQWLKSNKSLLKASLVFCKKRLVIENKKNQDVESELTLFDVLAVAGSENAQIITFVQGRSLEQQVQKKKNPDYELNKGNKIGNILGKKGRAEIKKVTGNAPIVDYDVDKGLKPGKKGPWRGYKALYDKISAMLGKIYRPIQAIGLTQRIVKREDGYSYEPKEAKKNIDDARKEPWKTDYCEMNESYYRDKNAGTLNLAGQFYEKTKSRLLVDKTNLQGRNAAKEFLVCSHQEYIEKSQAEIEKYQEAIAKTQEEIESKKENEPQQIPNLQLYIEFVNKDIAAINDDIKVKNKDFEKENKECDEIIEYLKKRIEVAEEILATKIPHEGSANFDNQTYYDNLEKQIYMEDLYSNNPAVLHYVKEKKYDDVTANINYAIRRFSMLGKNQKDFAKEATRKVAVDLFNLQDKIVSGEISKNDVDNLTNQFLASNELREIKEDLNNPGSRVGYNDVAKKVNNFVEKNLKNKFMNDLKQDYDKYDDYMANQYHQEIVQQLNSNGMEL